jgi:hypothetical protein
VADPTTLPPRNPFYRSLDKLSLDHGPAELTLPGTLGPEDVADVREWLGIVLRRLARVYGGPPDYQI